MVRRKASKTVETVLILGSLGRCGHQRVWKRDLLRGGWTAVALGSRLGYLTGAGRSAAVALDAQLGIIIHAGLETSGGDNLLLVLSPGGERMRSVVQHWVWPVKGQLQGRDDSSMAHLDKGGAQEVCWELARQLQAQIMFARQRKCRKMILANLLAIWST